MESQRMGRDVYARVAVGREVSGMQYADAMRFRETWRLRVRETFASADVLVTPTCPFPAPLVESAGDMARSILPMRSAGNPSTTRFQFAPPSTDL